MSKSVQCPFCLSDLREGAVVCPACGREVDLFFRRLKELGPKPAVRALAPKRDVAEFVGKVLLLAFYSIPALILAALPTIPSSAFDTINTWTFVAAVVVGAYWAAGVKGSNSWVMFFYGFAQPGMWVTFAVLLGSLDAAVLQRLLGELLLLATRVGVCAVLGFSATALIVSLIKPERVEKAFDPAVLGQWLDTAESGMTRSHRVLTTLFSLLTLLSPLLLRLLKVQP